MPRHSRSKPSPQQLARTRRHHLLWLVGITLLAYLSAVPGDFVWHDAADLQQGQYRITNTQDISAALTLPAERYRVRKDGSAPELQGGNWQPLTILANSVSWTLWGDCSACWHVESLLWHLLVVVGLYALGRHLLNRQRGGHRIAFWAAALFAVHPGTVSTVAWLGGRPTLLAAGFGVLALVWFSRLQATTNVPRRHVLRWLIASTLTAALAMLSQGSAYLLPIAALLLGMLAAQLRGRKALGGIAPVRWRALWLLLGTLGLVLWYRYQFVDGLHLAGSYPTDSVFNNAGTALRHFWYLVDQTLLPHEPIVSDAWKISYGWSAAEVAALLGLILLLAATLIGMRLGHPPAYGVAWFLLWVSPGVGILPAEHYHNEQTLYLALWGIMFGLVYLVSAAWRPISRQLFRGSEAIVLTPVLIVLMVITGFSNARWWDHEGLFESEIANDPHYIEGRLQLAEIALQQGRPVDALNHMLTALESRKNRKFTGYWDAARAYRLLGEVQIRMGLYGEAVVNLQEALKVRPQSASILHLLGIAQLNLNDYAEAQNALERALELKTDAAVKADLGVALLNQGQSDRGEALLTQALALPEVGNYRRHAALGTWLTEQKRYKTAQKHLEKALTYRENANIRAALALAQWNLGKHDQADENLSMAMQLDEQRNPYVERVIQLINNSEASSPEN